MSYRFGRLHFRCSAIAPRRASSALPLDHWISPDLAEQMHDELKREIKDFPHYRYSHIFATFAKIVIMREVWDLEKLSRVDGLWQRIFYCSSLSSMGKRSLRLYVLTQDKAGLHVVDHWFETKVGREPRRVTKFK